ncbi:MAG: CvpA family protein [Kiritimatiellae bacterium]|nr:CvpA family protein [Kiritimatiellia bacterium]MDW8458334.1 CvpA family protein [Verrucomicrobiota bacterium]
MSWMGLNLADWFVLAFMIFGLTGGIRRGLSGELTRMLIAAGCVAAVWRFSRPAADWVSTQTGWTGSAALLTAAGAVLLAAYFSLTLLRLATAAVFQFAFKGSAEKIGGALCGLIRSALVAALVLTLLSVLPHEPLHRHVAVESKIGRALYAYTAPWLDRMAEKVPELNLPRRETLPDDPPIDWLENDGTSWDAAPLGPTKN